MEDEQFLDVVALMRTPGVGSGTAKTLIAYCGSAGAVFRQKKLHLTAVPGIGEVTANTILSTKDEAYKEAEKELKFIRKHNITPYYFLDDEYPQRMRDLVDSPVILYFKGNSNLNYSRMLGIVGTRKATDYGKYITEKIVDDLAPYNVHIVSGLAFGIDGVAHKAALKNKMPTIGALGHGLNTIYPSAHRSLAVKMLENGGLVTEYPSYVGPDPRHFPARNRIVAGLVDGVLVVETLRTGGALITAEIANSYNRDVMAVPGRTNDEYSGGCNHFIKVNKAALVESAEDIAYQMGWDQLSDKPAPSLALHGLSAQEKKVVELLRKNQRLALDTLCASTGTDLSSMSMLLLELEFKGIVQALPGKFFRLHL